MKPTVVPVGWRAHNPNWPQREQRADFSGVQYRPLADACRRLGRCPRELRQAPPEGEDFAALLQAEDGHIIGAARHTRQSPHPA